MDWTLVYVLATILIIPSMIFGAIAQFNVNNTFDRYDAASATSGITAAELAVRLLASAGINNVKVERINGRLSDCYDPRSRTVKLSDATYASTSLSALGVCAHEVGHAVQHAKGTLLFRLRIALVPIVNFCSRAFMPLIIIGSLCSFLFLIPSVGYIIIWASVISYGASFVFYLVTYPVETDASKRALELLEKTGAMNEAELRASRKVLKAAAQTYLSALITSMLYFLRFLSILLSYKND